MKTRTSSWVLGVAGGLSLCWLAGCVGSTEFSASGAGGHVGLGGSASEEGSSHAGTTGLQPTAGRPGVNDGGDGTGEAGALSMGQGGETGGAGDLSEAGAFGEAGAFDLGGSGGAVGGSAGAVGIGGSGGSVSGGGGAGGSTQVSVVLQPGADGKDAQVTTLDGDSKVANTNYATGVAMLASAWTFSSVPVHMRSLIEFDLSKIPSGVLLESAVMVLSAAVSGPPGDPFAGHSTLSGSNDFWVESVSQAWNETTITWANQPKTTWSVSGTNSVQPGVHHDQTQSSNENVSVDVTGLVNQALSTPADYHGFMIHLNTDSYYRNLRFGTSDNPNPELRPKLTLKYTPAK